MLQMLFVSNNSLLRPLCKYKDRYLYISEKQLCYHRQGSALCLCVGANRAVGGPGAEQF